MQQSKKPVACVYRRVSTDKQSKSGLGLADQDRAIRELCEARGLTIAATFTEIESGKNDDRPELAKALATARRKGGIVVIATLSRLGRRVAFVSALMEQGVPFACADAPDDEPFILHIKSAFAEEEAKKISDRTKAALASLKAANLYSKAQGRFVTLGNPQNLSHDARVKGAAVVKARAAAEHATIMPEIIKARAEGLSVRAVAERVGVSPMSVSRLLRQAA